MHPIQKALSDVKNKIPRPILDRTFVQNQLGGRHTPVSLDYRIREEVINARVIPDCNLIGGTEVTIPLRSVVPKYLDPYNVIYRVPKELTQNRSISRVLNMTFGDGGAIGAMNMGMGGSAAVDAAQGVIQSHLPIPMVSTAYVQLVAENTVLIKDNIKLPGSLYLRCILEGDEEFTHLKPASMIAFSKLVEFAVKAYIFNNLAIDMDQAQLSGGMALGRFREIVDGYADANDLYDQHFNEVWQKVSVFNDPEAHRRHLKMAMGGRW